MNNSSLKPILSFKFGTFDVLTLSGTYHHSIEYLMEHMIGLFVSDGKPPFAGLFIIVIVFTINDFVIEFNITFESNFVGK